MSSFRAEDPILPGALIGILGGGQLARMTAMAARAMGYRIAVLDPDAECAAAPVVEEVVAAPFDDADAARRLAERCAVVTYEIERIAPGVLRAVEQVVCLRPGAAVLECVQDRMRQKRFLEAHGYPVGAWREVNTAAELELAIQELGPCRVKRTQGGYDGRSQIRVAKAEDAAEAYRQLGGTCVAEAALDLAMELSVLVARSPMGEVEVHPPAANWHRDGVLLYSLLPAPVDTPLQQRASELAVSLANDLRVEGILVVEMFVTKNGELLVNELAPRPHNTFHAVGDCCATSQFEQYVRAICGLPLGSTEVRGTTALVNLLGNENSTDPAEIPELLRIPGVSVHLYGKKPRPRRKIGHVVVRGNGVTSTQRRACEAMRLLGLESKSSMASFWAISG